MATPVYVTPRHPEQSDRQDQAQAWFQSLRDQICKTLETLEQTCHPPDPPSADPSIPPMAGTFQQKDWRRPGGGGGQMSMMRGRVFEKVGVNISTVWGVFESQFQQEIKGAQDDPRFWASGISLVAHPWNPLVPAVHMNTRYIKTTKSWFGGGADLNPSIPDDTDTKAFHAAFKQACDRYDHTSYQTFKDACDAYFFIKHRACSRGVGGIFYDDLDKNWEKDFTFTQDVGHTFLDIYPKIVTRHMNRPWTQKQRLAQLEYRGYYAEFNLVYDRGTRFGLMTQGHTDAILMSLPPEARWP